MTEAPRLSDIIGAAQRRFTVLAVFVWLECGAAGAAVGWLVTRTPLIGLGVGAGVGFIAFLLCREWGARLDHKPQGLRLVKAQEGAWLLALGVPWAISMTSELQRLLRNPVLVAHAVANHPESESREPGDVLMLIRTRAAFVALRTAGWIASSLGLVLIGGVIAGYQDQLAEGLLPMAVGVLSLVAGAAQLVTGWLGSRWLMELSPESYARTQRMQPLLWVGLPWGPFAALRLNRSAHLALHRAPPRQDA